MYFIFGIQRCYQRGISMQNRIIKYMLFGMIVWGFNTQSHDSPVQKHSESILLSDRSMYDTTISRCDCLCTFCSSENSIKRKINEHPEKSSIIASDAPKAWTILVYMAADNGLRRFAIRNIQEMAKIGSNEHFNLLVHLDIINGNEKISEFYYIEKNNVVQINVYSDDILPMDSGNPQTLLEFCKHGITGFPAKHHLLILWNHGTGTINPRYGRFINPSLLFSYNPLTNKLDLDRSVGYLDLVAEEIGNFRGVCWDDSTGNYLSNEMLAKTLKTICARYLGGKKFDIIGFDACLMAMTEVYGLLKGCGDIVIGSQEVELGTGWNYALLLMKLIHRVPTPEEFAQHIVVSYYKAYQSITNDYTLSAIRLPVVDQLENHIHRVATLLKEALANTGIATTLSAIIRKSRDPRSCTHFDEPSYIDLYHFYDNLEKNIDQAKTSLPISLYTALKECLQERQSLFKSLVVAHTSGKNLTQSHGISIYFPFNKIHASYQSNDFFKTNAWGNFLSQYIYA